MIMILLIVTGCKQAAQSPATSSLVVPLSKWAPVSSTSITDAWQLISNSKSAMSQINSFTVNADVINEFIGVNGVDTNSSTF
jgi:hypothetical protein